MTQDEIIKVFEETGVILRGHFRLTSGRHSDMFLQCSQVMQYPTHAGKVCDELAKLFSDSQVDLVAGPALGGIVLAYEVARALGARTAFAEKENGKMTFRRGFAVRQGEAVLLVEDAVSTGGSVNEVAEAVIKAGGKIIGVGALVDRSGGKVTFGVPFRPLITMDIKSYSPAECPMCRDGIPLSLPKSAQA